MSRRPRTPPATDPVEDYLDRLLLELRGRAPDVRRVMTEVEHHLADAVRAAEAEGSTPEEAQARAVERMGSPRAVARRFSPSLSGAAVWPVVRQLALALAVLAGVALLAVGASGAVAAGMGAAFGKDFVSGDTAGVTYTPERCAEYLEYKPQEPTCAAAATAHHYDEVVGWRIDAGVLGAVVLGATSLVRRRWRRDDLLLPEGFSPIIAVTLFGAPAAGLLLQSAGQGLIGHDSSGIGQWLSGGVVAAAVAMAYLVPLSRTLLLRSAPAR